MRRTLRRRTRSRWPLGALVAVGMVMLAHVGVSRWVYPEPMPRREVRRKLIGLTAETCPQLIIAGDSRAECGVLPGELAAGLGLDPRLAINMASPACDLPGVLAGYREFADRFAAAPIMVVSVSVVDVNDRAHAELIGDETLWSLSLVERLQLVSPKRAITSLFMPERELLRRFVVEPLLYAGNSRARVAEQGYRGDASRHHYPPDRLQRELTGLENAWFNQPVFDGMRWRLFRDAVQALRAAGVQLVLLDMPMHPQLSAAMADSVLELSDREFHQQLADFCRTQGVPLVRTSADDLCADPTCADDPGSSFVSLVHLNRTGAARLTARLGEHISELLMRGILERPTSASPDVQ